MVAELSPTTPQVRLTRVWTRGDRFYVESVWPEERWAWGRDEANRFWIALGEHTAVRLEADEVPYGLNVYCDLHSLNIEQWLGEVLDWFEINRETSESPGTIRVRVKARQATPRPDAFARVGAYKHPYPMVQSADLEIDAETRVVRRMVVRRVWNGEPFATVTYSLAETDARDSADYRLEGHLLEPSEVFTRDHEPERRRELLARWLGPRATRWLWPREPVPAP